MPLWVRILLGGFFLVGASAAPGCGCGGASSSSYGASSSYGGAGSASYGGAGLVSYGGAGSSPYALPEALPGCGCLASALAGNCPPQVIINRNVDDGRGSRFSVTIEEPVIPPTYSQRSSSYTRPDPFTGKQYGLSMVAPPQGAPAPQPLGAFDADVQDVIPGSPYANEQQRRPEPSMNIQIQSTSAPSGPLGNFPVEIQEPVLPYSGSGDASGDQPQPVKLLTGLNARLDRIVLPASDLAAGPRDSPYWYGSTGCAACTC